MSKSLENGQQPQDDAVPAASMRALRILVVDDDAEAADEVASLLEDSGYPCQRATSPGEAIELDRHDPVDILVSDVWMPGMDGLELLANLQDAHPDRVAMQCIFMTAKPGYEEAARAIRLRAVDFLRKPVHANELLAAIGRAAAEIRRPTPDQQAESSPGTIATVNETLGRIEDQLAMLRSTKPGHAGAAQATPAPELRRSKVLALIRARSSRTGYFDSALFGDPCWDMLLDLMLARLTGKQVSVSSLCIAANVPSTTALRRLDEMIAAELVERVPDPDDRRRIHVRLTGQAMQRIERYLDQIDVVLSGERDASRS